MTRTFHSNCGDSPQTLDEFLDERVRAEELNLSLGRHLDGKDKHKEAENDSDKKQ